MKMIIGFVIGAVVCLLAILTISSQSKAAGDSTTSSSGINLASLLPNISGIFQQALALPYQQVEPEITDPSIAAYFSKYMAATGLDQVGTPSTSTAAGITSVPTTPITTSVATNKLPDGTMNTAYSQTLVASGGSGIYISWSITSGALPPGLSLDSSTGIISGVPTLAGLNIFTIVATDSNGGKISQALSINIKPG